MAGDAARTTGGTRERLAGETAGESYHGEVLAEALGAQRRFRVDDTGNPAVGSAGGRHTRRGHSVPAVRVQLAHAGRAGVCPECGLTIAETLTIRGLRGDMGAWKDLHGSANNLAWMPLILVGLMAILFAAGLMVPSLHFLWGSVACIFVSDSLCSW